MNFLVWDERGEFMFETEGESADSVIAAAKKRWKVKPMVQEVNYFNRQHRINSENKLAERVLNQRIQYAEQNYKPAAPQEMRPNRAARRQGMRREA